MLLVGLWYPNTVKKQKSQLKVLVVDIGGSNVKCLATGVKKRVKVPSIKDGSAKQMVAQVKKATADWDYDVVSIGAPCSIIDGVIVKEPHNLGTGWKGFDFEKAFKKPTKLINDATMQAIGAYEGGTMLFLGLGTGLGTTLIKNGTPVPMEGGHLPYRNNRSFEEYIGKAGLARMGNKRWRAHVHKIVAIFSAAFVTNDVVIGGGNAKLLQKLPPGARRVSNKAAFTGGFRLWEPETELKL